MLCEGCGARTCDECLRAVAGYRTQCVTCSSRIDPSVVRGRRITIAVAALYCCIAGVGAVSLYAETSSLLMPTIRIAMAALVTWCLVSGRSWMRTLLIGLLIVTNARKAVLALNEPFLFVEVLLALAIILPLAFSPSVQAFFARPRPARQPQ